MFHDAFGTSDLRISVTDRCYLRAKDHPKLG